MALKYEVESLDSIEEAHRSLYAEVTEDGATVFRLDVEGAVSRKKHHMSIENGRTLHNDLEASRKQLADLETERDALELKANEGEKKVVDTKTTLEERIANLESALTEKEKAAKALEATGRKAAARDIFKTAASPWARKDALDDIANAAAADGWGHNEEGALVRRGADGGTVFSQDNPGKAQTPEEYIGELVQRKPFYFEDSSGDGARGGTTTAKPGAKVIQNNPRAIGENAAAILSGDVVVAED